MNGERANASVVVYAGEGQYMVRTPSMQFPMELDAAMRSREAWVVSKGPNFK